MDNNSWHERFLQQSRWTTAVRKYLLDKVVLEDNWRALDVGCGTGAVENQWPGGGNQYGVDISWEFLNFFNDNQDNNINLTVGDAYKLPYQANCFDLVTCHFLLLWLSDPITVIREMIRVIRAGGYLIFFAEPDYGGRIDYPGQLEEIGLAQMRSLENQGADPLVGRKLLSYASDAGLKNTEVGILGYQTGQQQNTSFWDSEWEMIKHDLANEISQEKLSVLIKADEAARQDGGRILFVPTFYLLAIVD